MTDGSLDRRVLDCSVQVMLFAQMVGWAGEPWAEDKVTAYVHLHQWVRHSDPRVFAAPVMSPRPPGSPRPPRMNSETASQLWHMVPDATVHEGEAMLNRLRAKELISASGVQSLTRVTQRLVDNPDDPDAAVDIDTLLASWMATWGSWDKKREQFGSDWDPMADDLSASSMSPRSSPPSSPRPRLPGALRRGSSVIRLCASPTAPSAEGALPDLE